MNTFVILNPFSGRWSARERWPEAKSALESLGIGFEFQETEGPRHATALAEESVSKGYDAVIAAGGDGLVGEVINGLVKAAGESQSTPFGVLPLGTANDLVDNLGMPRDLTKAAAMIGRGETRPIDIIQVNDHYFINNGGLGLESYVSIIQNQMTWARGMLRYILAAVRGIADNPQWEMALTWDGGEYAGPVTMVSIANGPRTGGVFYTVPHADPFDGQLSFVYAHVSTRREILKVFPMIMKSGEGNYTEHPAVNEINATWLKIHADPPTPMHADGEILETAIQDLEYRVHPAKVPLFYSSG